MDAERPHTSEGPPNADAVDAYLRRHPAFLSERPHLFALLDPPCRVHGEVLADHMTAMVDAARAREAGMTQRADEVLAASRAGVRHCRAGAGGGARPAACRRPGGMRVGNLTGSAGRGCRCTVLRRRKAAMARPSPRCGARADVRPDHAVRDRPADAAMVHAEAALLAERDMLLLLPATKKPALLALVSRDPAALPAVQSWGFLGRVLARLCETP